MNHTCLCLPSQAGTHLPTPEGWKAELAYCNLYVDKYLYICRMICLKCGWNLSRSWHKQYSCWSCHGSVVECFWKSFWHWFAQSCCMYAILMCSLLPSGEVTSLLIPICSVTCDMLVLSFLSFRGDCGYRGIGVNFCKAPRLETPTF